MDDPRLLNTGEGKVLMGLTARDLREIMDLTKDLDLFRRASQALNLLEGSKAREKFKNGG